MIYPAFSNVLGLSGLRDVLFFRVIYRDGNCLEGDGSLRDVLFFRVIYLFIFPLQVFDSLRDVLFFRVIYPILSLFLNKISLRDVLFFRVIYQAIVGKLSHMFDKATTQIVARFVKTSPNLKRVIT